MHKNGVSYNFQKGENGANKVFSWIYCPESLVAKNF